MSFSEIAIMVLVFSGLFIFFLVPFERSANITNQQKSKIIFKTVLKDRIFYILHHKKAIFAYILLAVTLLGTWFGYASAEDHINAHSGRSPISMKENAYFTIGIILFYSLFLFFLIVFMNARRVCKE
ncbi:hypothetical protein ACTHO0_09260 [Cytobacillus praedii]|uniref:hypothetical protein n=1 Tax=Cytobacillus praedii TaxID=1742358 RepID=UPI002E23330C|nr:hypothetical protein [Cytobacillus praedii]